MDVKSKEKLFEGYDCRPTVLDFRDHRGNNALAIHHSRSGTHCVLPSLYARLNAGCRLLSVPPSAVAEIEHNFPGLISSISTVCTIKELVGIEAVT